MSREEFEAFWGLLIRHVGDEYASATPDPYVWLHTRPIKKEDLYRRMKGDA